MVYLHIKNNLEISDTFTRQYFGTLCPMKKPPRGGETVLSSPYRCTVNAEESYDLCLSSPTHFKSCPHSLYFPPLAPGTQFKHGSNSSPFPSLLSPFSHNAVLKESDTAPLFFHTPPFFPPRSYTPSPLPAPFPYTRCSAAEAVAGFGRIV